MHIENPTIIQSCSESNNNNNKNYEILFICSSEAIKLLIIQLVLGINTNNSTFVKSI